MNAKDFLDEIYYLNEEINTQQQLLDKLNSQLFSISKELTPDRVKTSKNKDPLGSTVAKIIDLQNEINEMIDNYVDKLSVARKIINQVENKKERELLNKHYLLGLSWKNIADEWGNSNTWVHEVKRNALDSVQKILDKEGVV